VDDFATEGWYFIAQVDAVRQLGTGRARKGFRDPAVPSTDRPWSEWSGGSAGQLLEASEKGNFLRLKHGTRA